MQFQKAMKHEILWILLFSSTPSLNGFWAGFRPSLDLQALASFALGESRAITCKDKLMLSLLLAFKSMEATATIFICGMKEFEIEFTVQICLAGR